MTEEEIKSMWVPEVIFHNTEAKVESIIDGKAFTTVKRHGEPTYPNLEQLHNAHIYPGKSNAITTSRVYSLKFLCEFDMAVYPFDTQSCFATLVMKGNSGKFVRLNASKVAYMGPIELTIYFVKNITFSNVMIQTDTEAVQVELKFGRRILNTLLTTYLPTLLICLVSFSTNYFKAFFFEAIVTVNLTSLLVLTTLFISVSQSLPQTAYVKLLDVWLIVCLIVPFSEVLLQVRSWFHLYYIVLRAELETSSFLQTYIEYCNVADEINHHGSSIFVDEAALVTKMNSEKENISKDEKESKVVH